MSIAATPAVADELLRRHLPTTTGVLHAVLLLDAAVAGHPAVAQLTSELTHAGWSTTRQVLPGPGDLASALTLARQLPPRSPVIALGGGSVVDQAKLAALLADVPTAERFLRVRQRSGLITLPPDLSRTRTLVVVPTTLGTGAEVSRMVCVLSESGKRLAVGEALRPDAAVVVPELLSTLPRHLVAEGLLEALFRTIGPYVGDDRAQEGDELAEATATALVELGDVIIGAFAAGVRPSPETLGEVLRLGGRSHLVPMHAGRDPFGARAWYLANELSIVFGVRKTQAIAALLPPLWRSVLDGETRLGAAARLRSMWARVRAAGSRPRSGDPAAGIADLIDSWGVQRGLPHDPALVAAAADRVVRSWGGGLPMLAGLHRDEVHAMLARAVTATDFPAPRAAGGPPTDSTAGRR